MFYIFGSLGVSTMFLIIPHRFQILPYSCAVLVLSICLYAILTLAEPDQSPPHPRLSLSPDLIQAVFLPPLLFSDLFKGNVHKFYSLATQSVILAVPAVLLQVGFIAPVARYLFPYVFDGEEWSWGLSLAFGGMAAPTDPIAALAVLGALGASENLIGAISGESIMNDGVGVLLVNICLKYVSGQTFTAEELCGIILAETVGALAFGVAMGIVTVVLLYLLRHNTDAVVCMTVATPYLTFTACLYGMEISGVLAVLSQALVVNYFGKSVIVGKAAERMEQFWEQLEFIGITLLFFYSGSIIVSNVADGNVGSMAWAIAPAFYLYCMIARMASILILFPLLRVVGPGLTLKQATVVSWAGLRGGVGLALGLTIAESEGVSDGEGAHALFFMSVLVVGTMTINAKTVAPLLKWFDLIIHPNQHLLRFHKQQMYEQAELTMRAAGVEPNIEIVKAHGLSMSEVSDNHNDEMRDTVQPLSAANISATALNQPRTMADSEVADDNFSTLQIGDQQFDVHRDTMAQKREGILRTYRITYDWLLEHGLISKITWFVLSQGMDLKFDSCHESLENHWPLLFKEVLRRHEGDDLACWQKCTSVLDYGFSLHDYAEASLAFAFMYAHLKGLEALEVAFHQQAEYAEVRAIRAESEAAILGPLQILEKIRVSKPDSLRNMKCRQLKGCLSHRLNKHVTELLEQGVVHQQAALKLEEFVDEIMNSITLDNVQVTDTQKPFDSAERLLHHPDCYPFNLQASAPVGGSTWPTEINRSTRRSLQAEANADQRRVSMLAPLRMTSSVTSSAEHMEMS